MICTGNRVGSDQGLLGVTTQVSQAVLMNSSGSQVWKDMAGLDGQEHVRCMTMGSGKFEKGVAVVTLTGGL